MNTLSRSELLARFRQKISDGRPIVGGGAGTGLSAKCAEAAGLDFIVIYNSGRYRMAGRSSMAGLMPYGDANAIVMEMGQEVLPVTENIPVMAGVCGTDPFRDIPRFLDKIKAEGFAGIQNYPTVCLFDGMIRANLEETGLGFYREVELVRAARERDLITLRVRPRRGRGGGDDRRRRRRPGAAHGPDHLGHDRRQEFAHPGRVDRAGHPAAGRDPRRRSRTRSSSATAARSPPRRTPGR